MQIEIKIPLIGLNLAEAQCTVDLMEETIVNTNEKVLLGFGSIGRYYATLTVPAVRGAEVCDDLRSEGFTE